MPENGTPDITDQTVGRSPGAGTRGAIDDGDRPWWTKSSPGTLAGIGLMMGAAEPVEINETDPAADVARRVGDPEVAQIGGLHHVGFWIGADSAVTSEPNHDATYFLRFLFTDIRDGDYPATDEERAHIRGLFDTDTLPVIHGSCLITGVNERGDVAPLDDNFQAWFAALLAEMAPQPQDVHVLVLSAYGIPDEELADVDVAHLG